MLISGGGYSSEATAIALALDNEFPLAIEQVTGSHRHGMQRGTQ